MYFDRYSKISTIRYHGYLFIFNLQLLQCILILVPSTTLGRYHYKHANVFKFEPIKNINININRTIISKRQPDPVSDHFNNACPDMDYLKMLLLEHLYLDRDRMGHPMT